ncbi:hypothetical protein cyc_02684 [Cyclospora cayetanensis]|uniref:Uncharacterized protein n=1 Tax=Cyclospora cayetanensis TaxID=88456 RepID=A0A1D3D6U3_9EIME|nr:hypothetical protein cyc_02684 [Cyclospora cayetanensis]
MEHEAAETQELCVQALRSVRSASDADLLATLNELEALVPHVEGDITLINTAAAHELLCISLDAMNCLRMPVAQAALRLFNNGLRDERLIDILAFDANLSVALLRLAQKNGARIFVLLGESIYSQIIHKALHAIFPEAQGQRRGAVPAEEFDFYRKLAAYESLPELLLRMNSFDLEALIEWRNNEQTSIETKDVFDASIQQMAKQRVVYDGIAIHIRESNPVRGSCDPWRHNGINEMRLHNQKSKILTVPLYAITHMRYEEKKIKLFFNQLLSEGSDPRMVLQDHDALFGSRDSACLSLKSEKEAAALHTRLANALRLDEMEAYDVAFVEGVIDEIREPLDTNQAEKLLAPSSLLWPNTTSKTSERQKLHNGRNGRPHQRIMFASTKDIDEDTTQAGLPRNGIDENRPNTADVRELICNQNGGFGSALLDIPLAVRCIVSIGNRASVFTPLRSAANAPENHWERDFALSQPTQKSLETAQFSEGGKDIEQLPAAGTIGAADASEVASASAACNDQIEKLQQLLMHQYPEKGRQRQREEVAESRHESETDESAPRSSELIKRRVQETKLSKVQEARHAVITLQQKIAKKLRTLLEVQNEEKNQLQLSFEQAKNNILSRVEQQIRATAELLPLSFSAPKALNAENAADTANKELQSLMDGMKRGIYDKLARATTVR